MTLDGKVTMLYYTTKSDNAKTPNRPQTVWVGFISFQLFRCRTAARRVSN